MSRPSTLTIADRARGCLRGIATGDAIGKQTEMLSRDDVVRWYPVAANDRRRKEGRRKLC